MVSKDETTNLDDMILHVIYHAKINWGNKDDNTDVFNATVLDINIY